jgi:hypothetical protein
MNSRRILNALGLHEWEIINSDDPWCCQSTKSLYVFAGDRYSLLHEATHALIGGGHRRHFWTLFEMLADYFLGGQLPAYQERMKRDYLGVD